MKPVSLFLASLLFAALALGQTPASSLKTTGAPVNVSQAAPPSGAGRACVTTNATHCTWQLLSGIGLLTLPVSIANGGTGIDGTNLLGFASTTGDSATTTFSLSATDTNANTSSVSWSIELPGDGASPGDAVLRTAAGEIGRALGLAPTLGLPVFQFAATTLTFMGTATPDADFATGFGLLNITSDPANAFAGIVTQDVAGLWDGTNLSANGVLNIGLSKSAVAATFQQLDPDGNNDLIQLKFKAFAGGLNPALGVFEFQNSGLTDGSGWFGWNFDGSNADPVKFFGTPTQTFGGATFGDVTGSTSPVAAIAAYSPTLPSALFQTSATDGSNANATVVVKGNTAQAANLLELYGTDGTTLNFAFSVTNILTVSSGITIATLGQNFQVDLGGEGGYTVYGNNGLHAWDSETKEMTFDNTGLLSVPGNVNAASFSGAEIATPAAPADGSGILYFKDAGGGKTGLYVRFPTGAEQQIKAEP